MRFKRVVFYDAERNHKTGRGNFCKTFTLSKFKDGELDDHIENIRRLQKKKNAFFRNRIRNGEIIDRNPGPLQRSFSNPIAPFINNENNFDVRKIPIKTSLILQLDKNTGNTTFIIGSSKAGKTTLLMHIFEKYYSSKKWITTLFSVNSQIRAYRNRKNLLRAPSLNRKAEKFIRMEKFINLKCKNKYNFANLFDDVIAMRFNNLINNLIMTYRNSNISSIISLQYSNLLSKCARSNINNVIAFSFNTDEAIKLVVNTYLKATFAKMNILSEIGMINFYKKMTLNHGFIYIHPQSNSVTFHRIPLQKLLKRKK